MIASHVKCRGGTYPRSNVQRFLVPDDKVSWSVMYENYNPPSYTSPCLKGKPYADLDISKYLLYIFNCFPNQQFPVIFHGLAWCSLNPYNIL